MSLKEKLAQIQAEAIESMLSAADPDVLNDIRVRFLGKKGLLTEASKGMKDVPAEERPKMGQLVNDTKKAIEETLEKRKSALMAAVREKKMAAETIDLASVDLLAAQQALGEITGDQVEEKLLDRVFADFCVGK